MPTIPPCSRYDLGAAGLIVGVVAVTGWWEPGAHQAKADTRTSGRREPATTTSEEGKALPVSPRQKCYKKNNIWRQQNQRREKFGDFFSTLGWVGTGF